jgi:hypothetical protein
MLASVVKPSSTSTSSAHSLRRLIDHSGARKVVTTGAPRRTERSRARSQVLGECRTIQVVYPPVPEAVRSHVVAGPRGLSRRAPDIARRPSRQ